MPTFNPGDVYHALRIERFIAAGAHGEVFAARHIGTGQPFALKIMQLADRAGAGTAARALAAGRGAWSISHRNVVRVHDFGCDPDGMVYLVMDLLCGCSIAELLRWGRVSAVFAISVAIEAARGLGAAHGALVVHRDVKPANLFLVNEGPNRASMKVLDFSTAKVFQDQEGIETTRGGRAGLGTPAYMAPEQLCGAPPHPGMDVFGLGTTLWELLAGFHPFHAELGDQPALLVKQRDVMPPLLSEVADLPPRVDDVVRRLIAKQPAARCRTMGETEQALAELRAWLVEEDRAGRAVLMVPAGQPPIPGELNPYDVPAAPAPAAPAPDGSDPGAALPGGAMLPRPPLM